MASAGYDVRILHGYVQSILRRHDTDQDIDTQLNSDGPVKCGLQLHPHIRKTRTACPRHHRSRNRLEPRGTRVSDILHRIYPHKVRQKQIWT